MPADALLIRIADAVQRNRDSISELRQLADELQDVADRMRGMSERLQAPDKNTLDTPGVLRLPRGIVPRDVGEGGEAA